MDTGETLDLVRCAAINLDNLARAVPGLSNNPYFKIVKYQLACVLAEEGEQVPELSF